MKQLFWGLCITSLVALFASCEKLSNLNVQDETLVSQIAESNAKLSIAAAELPTEITGYIASNYGQLGVQVANKVEGKGFEIGLDNDVYVYFNENRDFLGHFSGPHGHGGHGGYGGPGGPADNGGCMHGDSVDIATLPAAIADYVALNYPGATIAAAVVKFSGNYAVELSDGTILFFDVDGNYIAACGAWGDGPAARLALAVIAFTLTTILFNWQVDCLEGTAVDIASLPQVIVDNITENAPTGVTIAGAVVKANGDYAVALSNGAVLIFDADGNFEHPCGGHGVPGGH